MMHTFLSHFSLFDVLLIVTVSGMATVLAYLYEPRWKALMLNLPIPFTISALALGHQIDLTNVLGFVLLLLYTHGVRWLHCGLRVQIVIAIVVAALGYCGAGWLLAGMVPRQESLFWWGLIVVFLLGVVLLVLTPHREEPGHREPLPVWIKLPLTMLVTLALVMMKQGLAGFMTLFPMVGVFAAYEGRRSLWTIGRQMPVLMLTVLPLIAVAHYAYPYVGLGGSLALGWAVFLCILIPLTRGMWKAQQQQREESA